MQHMVGEVRLVKRDEGVTIEQLCKTILEGFGYCVEEYDSAVDAMQEELFDSYIVYKDELYDIITVDDVEFDECSVVKDNKDGTFSVNVRFYNGGACFADIFCDGIDSITNGDE